MKEVTVVIAGAGPVGLALAALLLDGRCGSRLRVCVLEQRFEPRWALAQTDLRVYALSRASQAILERAGAWQRMAHARVSPYRRMRVWEGESPFGAASLEFDSADLGEPDLGHIVEDSLIRVALLDIVRAFERAEVRFGAAPVTLRTERNKVAVTLTGGERLEADVLIAADGSRSTVRALAGLTVVEREYGQQGLVTHVASERSHEETAWQRFLPEGPLAFLPLSDGRSSVVWSLPNERAERLLAAENDVFLRELQTASAGALGRLGPASARAAFPLRVMHAPRYCAPRVALIGDAAHTVHPLAGQGMNLGLLDAACLADVLDEALRRGEHPGDLRVLRRYERRRKGDDLKMLLALDALHHLFRMRGALGSVRALGLGLVNRSALAKQALVREALGVSALPAGKA